MPTDATPQHADFVIIGAGFSGLGAAIRLRQAVNGIVFLIRTSASTDYRFDDAALFL